MSDRHTEAEIFLSVANWLEENGYQFYVHVPEAYKQTDTYGHLTSQYQTHTLSIGAYKPDILGFTPSNRVFAVEVKGTTNLRKGLGQAISYQRGVDHSYLAAAEGAIDKVRDLALGKGIGVLRVDGSSVEQRHPYSAEMKDLLYNTRRQLENLAITITPESRRLPNYADPLNQLMPVLAIGHHDRTTQDGIDALCKETEYPYRSVATRMVKLAGFLGLLRQADGEYRLTEQGELCETLLRGYQTTTIQDLMALKGSGPLWKNHPPLATFLRNRFSSRPDFRTLFEVLLRHDARRISIQELAEVLITTYPNTFLNLVYTSQGDDREAPELIAQGRGEEIYDDPEYLTSIIHSQFISNTVSQFRSLGILSPETPVIEPKTALEPAHDFWYPRSFQLG